MLELLHLGGRSLPHAVLMMIPEAWENHAEMDPARRAFYEFHSTFMEPWDGPACVAFTDGTLIGAVLDRNGLRPGRYWVTDDGLVVLRHRGRGARPRPGDGRRARAGSQPGRMFLVDTEHGRIIDDEEIKSSLAAAAPVRRVAARRPDRPGSTCPSASTSLHTAVVGRAGASRPSATPRRSCGSCSTPDGRAPAPSRSARWARHARSRCCPSRPRLLFDYFTQLFAQVTNPPLDAIREELVTSLGIAIGPEGNLLAASPAHARQLVLPFPVIDNDELAKIVHINADGDLPGYRDRTSSAASTRSTAGARRCDARLEEIFAEVVRGDRRRRAVRRALRPRLRRRPGADPVAAAHLAPCTTT